MVRSTMPFIIRSISAVVAGVVIWDLGGSNIACGEDLPRAEKSQSETSPANDAATLAVATRQFFDALEDFSPGDLVVASQVEDLQSYLRRTFGPCRLTSPRVLRTAVPDRAPLARLFYSKGGKSVLRAASTELNGYAAIDALCRSNGGRALIERAIALEDPNIIVARAEGSAESKLAEQSADEANTTRRSRRARRTVYTIDEMLERRLGLNATTAKKPDSRQATQNSPSSLAPIRQPTAPAASATVRSNDATKSVGEPAETIR